MEKVPDDHTGEVDVGVMGNLGPIALRHWVSPVLPKKLHQRLFLIQYL